jgi:hypothetical protein
LIKLLTQLITLAEAWMIMIMMMMNVQKKKNWEIGLSGIGNHAAAAAAELIRLHLCYSNCVHVRLKSHKTISITFGKIT